MTTEELADIEYEKERKLEKMKLKEVRKYLRRLTAKSNTVYRIKRDNDFPPFRGSYKSVTISFLSKDWIQFDRSFSDTLSHYRHECDKVSKNLQELRNMRYYLSDGEGLYYPLEFRVNLVLTGINLYEMYDRIPHIARKVKIKLALGKK